MAADSIKLINGAHVDFDEEEAYAFKIGYENGDIEFSESGSYHGKIKIGTDSYFEGRIWIDRKIISFWYFNFSDMESKEMSRNHRTEDTSVFTFRETLDIIEKKFNKRHDDKISFKENWMIDVPYEWIETDIKPYTEYNTKYVLMPITEFETSTLKDVKKEDVEYAKKIHMMSWEEKQKWQNKNKYVVDKRPYKDIHKKWMKPFENMKYIKSFNIFNS